MAFNSRRRRALLVLASVLALQLIADEAHSGPRSRYRRVLGDAAKCAEFSQAFSRYDDPADIPAADTHDINSAFEAKFPALKDLEFPPNGYLSGKILGEVRTVISVPRPPESNRGVENVLMLLPANNGRANLVSQGRILRDVTNFISGPYYKFDRCVKCQLKYKPTPIDQTKYKISSLPAKSMAGDLKEMIYTRPRKYVYIYNITEYNAKSPVFTPECGFIWSVS